VASRSRRTPNTVSAATVAAGRSKASVSVTTASPPPSLSMFTSTLSRGRPARFTIVYRVAIRAVSADGARSTDRLVATIFGVGSASSGRHRRS
jgi:hypothetical protein